MDCVDERGRAMAERLMLRPTEAAEALGVSRSKAYELIASGELPVVRVGGCVRVPVAALREWINRRLSETEPATP
jgi:excisionase family DNA binding protein